MGTAAVAFDIELQGVLLPQDVVNCHGGNAHDCGLQSHPDGYIVLNAALGGVSRASRLQW